MDLSRRAFVGGSVLAVAGCAFNRNLPRHRSDYDGVRVGAITYSYWKMPRTPGALLGYVLGSGIGSIELMGTDMELDLGMPFAAIPGRNLKPAEYAAQVAWRTAVDFGRIREFRRWCDDAGVGVHIVKFGTIGSAGMSDAETEYCFKVAQTMGAGAITREIPDPKNLTAWKDQAMRLRPFMDKYGVKIAFHNHLQINTTTYDGPLLDWSDDFRVNFDIGHYVAANDDDPLAFVRKYHDRLFSIHLKDRTTKGHGQKDLPFGTGDTPLAGLFALLKREGWDVPCDIELEYAIPSGSDAVREVGVCNRYCRNVIEA